jgi:sugar phosphate isomerase/epimerase
MKLSRRQALRSGAAILLAGAGAGCALPGAGISSASSFFAARNLPIGVQLYAIGEGVREDFPGTMRALAAIGYRAVQLAGFHGQSPRSMRSALDANGIACTSAHIAPQLRPGEPSLAGDIGQLAADLHAIGVKKAITPVFLIPDRIDGATRPGETRGQALARVAAQLDADDWRRNADFLNQKGEALRREGLSIGYHNHNAEFAPLAGGLTGYSLLVAHTDPALVSLELDVGWAVMAGQDVGALLQAFPGRFTHVHVKDVTRDVPVNFSFMQSSVEVGQGVIDWRELLSRLFDAGVRTFTVEQDPPFMRARLEAAAMSFAHLSRIPA